MNKAEQMNTLMNDNNGYLLTSDVTALGISKTYLSEYVKKHNLKRICQGVYASDDVWIDELYIAYVRNKKIIYSGETALYIHGLMEREPFKNAVTVCSGYNANHLKKIGFDVSYSNSKIWELGRSLKATHLGNVVSVYDIDRTICDLIKNKDKYDIQVFSYALNEYMKGKSKNLNNLMKYAKALRIEEKVRMYTEVMI